MYDFLLIPNAISDVTLVVSFLPSDEPVEEGSSPSVINQPVHQMENPVPDLPTSESDQFLTTPDESEEKIITQDGTELIHRAPKKDLLEIDRFTICGNRIDWRLIRSTVQNDES